ncbi:MAG: hypothetical protein ACLPT6_04690 [Desulfobaccales bacterium]
MTEIHWNYFLAIEDDLERLSRFVEIDRKNFESFSIEISRILLAASAEVDVVCKQICKKLNPHSTADIINAYRDEICANYPAIPNFEVVLPRYSLSILPWEKWKNSKGDPPDWWTAYNKLKHHRHTEYHRANLENALNSVAGLFVMVLYLYKEKATQGELRPSPHLLQVSTNHFGGTSMGGYHACFSTLYKL